MVLSDAMKLISVVAYLRSRRTATRNITARLTGGNGESQRSPTTATLQQDGSLVLTMRYMPSCLPFLYSATGPSVTLAVMSKKESSSPLSASASPAATAQYKICNTEPACEKFIIGCIVRKPWGP